MKYLVNSFSLNMLPLDSDVPLDVRITPIAARDVPVGAVSYVGHADLAKILSDMLGRKIEFNRSTLRVDDRSDVYVAQYVGERLPEGATSLPSGATIRFYHARIG